MLEHWSPVYSGLIGGVIAAVLMALVACRKPRENDGLLVLEYAGFLRLIMIVSIIAMPAVAFAGIIGFLLPLFSLEHPSLSEVAIGIIVPAILILLGIWGPHSGYRAIFETVRFDENGFWQARSFPRWERFVSWSDIEKFGYNDWFQTYWIKPRSGPVFLYYDGMQGLNEFQSRLLRKASNEERS